jgi:hypothetical protein
MPKGEEQRVAWTGNSWYHAMARQNFSKEFFAHDLTRKIIDPNVEI